MKSPRSMQSLLLINSGLGREGLHLVRQREEMNRAVTDFDLTPAVEPRDRMLEPVLIVALRIVLARVGAAALGPVLGGVQGTDRLLQQILEFERLGEIAVPDHRTVRDAEIAEAVRDHVDSADTLSEHFGCAEDGAIVLHYALHVEADLGRPARPL